MAVAALIGDVVGSRTAADRADVHARLAAAVSALNAGDLAAGRRPLRALRITVGDEYQGCFASVGEAVQAALRLRVALGPEVDVRHGIGWGTTTVLDDAGIEDGPAWWVARDAIVLAEQAADSAASRSRRTAYARAERQDGPDPGAVNAALLLTDELVSGLSDRSLSVLRGLLSGVSQKEIAASLGVSASAVSQRVRADGLGSIVAAHDLMGTI